MKFIDYGCDLAEPWRITEYGKPSYVNILDAHRRKIVWQIEHCRAKRIIAAMALVASARPREVISRCPPRVWR